MWHKHDNNLISFDLFQGEGKQINDLKVPYFKMRVINIRFRFFKDVLWVESIQGASWRAFETE